MTEPRKPLNWTDPISLMPWLRSLGFGDPAYFAEFSRPFERLCSLIFLSALAIAAPGQIFRLGDGTWFETVSSVAQLFYVLSFLGVAYGMMAYRASLSADLDERERRERDAAHLYAYKLLLLVLGLSWVAFELFQAFGNRHADIDVDLASLLFTLLLAGLALPHIVLIWLAPEDDTADVDGPPPAR